MINKGCVFQTPLVHDLMTSFGQMFPWNSGRYVNEVGMFEEGSG